MFRVATFNAGLAVGVLPHVSERLPKIIDALAALEVDLLFVQEFWLESHWQRLRAALAGSFPFAFRPEPIGRTGSCTAEQLEPLRLCGELHCQGLRDERLARCIVQSCSSIALALPPDCIHCIASRPEGSLDEILGRCTQDAAQTISPASSRSGAWFAYGGSFGTGLFLREPPLETDTLTFESTLNARGALFARVRTLLDPRPLHVFAAHLSPGGPEQAPQLEALLAWIDQKSDAAPAPELLLGDLNVAPGTVLFRALEQAGFRDAGPAHRPATYSSEGLLRGHFAESTVRLDHVLVRRLDAQLLTERILDHPVTLAADTRGARLPLSTLSDHAGVACAIHPTRPAPQKARSASA